MGNRIDISDLNVEKLNNRRDEILKSYELDDESMKIFQDHQDISDDSGNYLESYLDYERAVKLREYISSNGEYDYDWLDAVRKGTGFDYFCLLNKIAAKKVENPDKFGLLDELFWSIIRAGADLNRCDENSTSPLMLLARLPHELNNVKLLYLLGAHLEQRDAYYLSALDYATISNNFQTADFLKEAIEYENNKKIGREDREEEKDMIISAKELSPQELLDQARVKMKKIVNDHK